MNYNKINYVFFSVIFICLSSFSYGQTYPIYQKLSAIAVLDQESLFSETDWGKNILKNVEERVNELATENRFIEGELELEEFNLTKTRKIIEKNEFDILAFKFDEKVKKIRDEQALKQREINDYLNENRKLFFEKITPILLSYIDELGIEVLLNKDTVALASLGSDITKSAINRINEKLED